VKFAVLRLHAADVEIGSAGIDWTRDRCCVA